MRLITLTGSILALLLASPCLTIADQGEDKKEAEREAGKPVNGLAASAEVVEHKPAQKAPYFEVKVSLKNVADKPITICIYNGNQPLIVDWTGPDGKKLHSDHYFYALRSLAPLSERAFVTIPAGAVYHLDAGSDAGISFKPSFEPKLPWGYNPAKPGKHRVRVSYVNKEDGKKFNLKNVWTGTVSANEVVFSIKQDEKKPSPAEFEARLLKALADDNAPATEELAADIARLSDQQRRGLKFRVRPNAMEFRFDGQSPGHASVEFLLSNQNRAYESLLVLDKAELERVARLWQVVRQLAKAGHAPALEFKLLFVEKGQARIEDLQNVFHKINFKNQQDYFVRFLAWEEDGLRIRDAEMDHATAPRGKQNAQMIIILRPTQMKADPKPGKAELTPEACKKAPISLLSKNPSAWPGFDRIISSTRLCGVKFAFNF
jgi:hypothetical protein